LEIVAEKIVGDTRRNDQVYLVYNESRDYSTI